MKAILFSMTLGLLAASLPAQNDAFPTSNASWHNLHINYFSGGSGTVFSRELTHLFLDGDSVVDNQTYHKVMGFSKDSNQVRLRYLYRVEGEKVYRYQGPGQEFMAYNFDLNVGDTFRAEMAAEKFIVQKIDSITLHDGKHKVIDFGPAKLIRGVGSVQGLFTFMGSNVSQFSDELVCFSHRDTTLYPQYSDTACYRLYRHLKAEEPASTQALFTLYPNPAHGKLQIKNIQVSDQIHIYNTLGREVQVARSQNRLDIAHLPAGVYRIQIQRGRQQFNLSWVKD